MKIVNCIAVAALAMGLSACALSEDDIALNYVPPPGAAVPVAGANGNTVDVEVVDERSTDRDRVSVKKNGYGMEMAPIKATNNPTDVLKTALEQELAAEGFKTGPGGAILTAHLLRLFNDFKMGMFSGDAVADISFNIDVKDAQGVIVYTRAVQTQGSVKNTMLANGSNAKAALEAALTNAIELVRADKVLATALIKAAAPAATPKKPIS